MMPKYLVGVKCPVLYVLDADIIFGGAKCIAEIDERKVNS